MRHRSAFRGLSLIFTLSACTTPGPITQQTANITVVAPTATPLPPATARQTINVFKALGGAGLDPTIESFCNNRPYEGEQGYAEGVEREYRAMVARYLEIGGSASPQPGSERPTDGPTPFPSAQPSSAGTPQPLPSATSDISVIETTTFNGNVFDANGESVDGVRVVARSLNSSVPFVAETNTDGGTYSFNNAPSGVQIEITVYKEGYAPRRRVEVLKSNKQGDPNANKYDFGAGDSGYGSGSVANAISDKPEVTAVRIDSPTENTSVKGLMVRFSEPVKRDSVETTLGLYGSNTSGQFDAEIPIFLSEKIKFTWNPDDTEVTLTFPVALDAESAKSLYLAFLENGGTLIDKSGVMNPSNQFKVTEGNYESVLSLKRAYRPNATPTPMPTPQMTPVPTPTPAPQWTPLPPPVSEQSQFYFSYDDSASTAGVELTKQALLNNQRPNPEWLRPWEFLNYETFDRTGQRSTGLFKVSMGITEKPHPQNPLLKVYELGAQVSAPMRCRETRKPLVLTILVDVSTSMSEASPLSDENGPPPAKFAIVKQGLERLQSQLREGDTINLIPFSNRPMPALQAHVLNADDKVYAEAVKDIELLGGTNLQAALEEGYRQAKQTYQPDHMNRLLLITDAHPTEGVTDLPGLQRLAAESTQQGIYLSALGVGQNHNHTLLNELTESGRGAYMSVVTRTDMLEAVRHRFIPLMEVAARNVRFKLEHPGWMYHGESAAEQVSTVMREVQPSNFSFNTSQYFWEQFMANGDAPLTGKLLRLSISYIDATTNQQRVEVYEQPFETVLGQEHTNIQAAYWVHLFTRLGKGEISAEVARKALAQ